MVWHGWEPDPITDPAASDVLAAYEAATEAHLPTVDCYLAGVEAWHRAPRPIRPYARKQAVAVILGAKVSLRIPDE
jgi:hypothetical protein